MGVITMNENSSIYIFILGETKKCWTQKILFLIESLKRGNLSTSGS